MIPATGAPLCGDPATYNGRGNGGGGSGRREEEEVSGPQASDSEHGAFPFPCGFTCILPIYTLARGGGSPRRMAAR